MSSFLNSVGVRLSFTQRVAGNDDAATDLRNRHDLSNRLDRPGIWRILFQGQMTSRIEVVSDVSFQRPSQMPLSKNDHVIETLSANATDEPFRKWIFHGLRAAVSTS